MSNASSPAASPLSLPSCPIPGISTFARALFYIPSKVVEMGLPVSPVWHPVLERLRTRWESCSLLPQFGVALDVFNLRSSCRGCLLNSRGKQQQHITNERQYIRITVLLSIVFVCKVVSMGGYHNRKSPLNFILKGTLSQHNLPLQWRYVTWYGYRVRHGAFCDVPPHHWSLPLTGRDQRCIPEKHGSVVCQDHSAEEFLVNTEFTYLEMGNNISSVTRKRFLKNIIKFHT